ncbi:MAG: hypothetical protein ABI980_13800 [Nitrospirota bacterium]
MSELLDQLGLLNVSTTGSVLVAVVFTILSVTVGVIAVVFFSKSKGDRLRYGRRSDDVIGPDA